MKKMLEKFQNENSFLSRVVRLCFVFLPLTAVRRILDNDIWFIMNHGRYILTNGLPEVEPFTIHEGWAFTMEKWLTNVLYYKIYDLFGETGLWLFITLIAALICLVVYRLCVYVSDNKNLSALITSVALIPFMFGYLRTRPQTISYLIIILEIWTLEHYARENRKKYLFILPVLSILFMQFHSTMWPMFFVLMMPYLFDFSFVDILDIEGGSAEKKWVWLTALVCAAVGIINPYGFQSVTYLIRSYGVDGMKSISELAPSGLANWIILGGAPLFIHLAWGWSHKEKLPLRYFFMIVGTFLLGSIALRNIAYFVLCTAFIVAWEFRDICFSKAHFRGMVMVFIILPMIIFFKFSTEADYYSATYGKDIIDDFSSRVEAADEVRLYTSFNTGSYAEWLGYKCYADPRAEVFDKNINGKESILGEIMGATAGKTAYEILQEKYNFTHWIIEKSNPQTYYMLKDENYELITFVEDYCAFKYIGRQ